MKTSDDDVSAEGLYFESDSHDPHSLKNPATWFYSHKVKSPDIGFKQRLQRT